MKNLVLILGFILITVVRLDTPNLDIPVPKVHLIHGNDHKTVESQNVDLTAEYVTPIFQGLQQRLVENGRTGQLDEYVIHKIKTDDDRNDRLLLTYTVSRTEDGQGFNYVAKLKTGNAYAEKEEDRIHEQVFKFKCQILDPLDEFVCLPEGCDLTPFTPTNRPKKVCEDNYVQSQVAITTVFEITKNTEAVKAFLECVEQHLEIVTLDSNQICYYVGFKDQNTVTKEELEQKLRDEGYSYYQGKWEKYTEEYDRDTVDRSGFMDEEDPQGEYVTTAGIVERLNGKVVNEESTTMTN